MLSEGNLPPINERQRASSSTTHSLKPIDIKRRMLNRRILTKKLVASAIPKGKKILINKDKELVANLDQNQNGYDFFSRQESLLRRKNRIDDLNEKKMKGKKEEEDPIAKSNKNKKESLEKLEAKNIERQNEEALKNKKIQFEQKKKDYEQLVNTINKVIKENEDIDIEIHVIDNYHKYFQSLPLVTINQGEDEKDKKKKKELLFQKQNLLISEQVKRNNRKIKITEEKEENIKIIANLREKLTHLKEEVKTLREEILTVQKTLSDHYHLLLYEGINLKSEGLIYLIKKIWNIGMNVDLTFMPKFLDQGCIDYLFTAAKKSIELLKMKQIITDHKAKFAQALQNEDKEEEQQKKSDSKFFATKLSYDLTDPNTERKVKYPLTKLLMERFHKEKQKQEEKLNFKSIQILVAKRRKFSSEIMNHFATLEKLNFLLSKMEIKFNDDKTKEIERIRKEFASNDYEKKYNVNINTVLTAISGTGN